MVIRALGESPSPIRPIMLKINTAEIDAKTSGLWLVFRNAQLSYR